MLVDIEQFYFKNGSVASLVLGTVLCGLLLVTLFKLRVGFTDNAATRVHKSRFLITFSC